MQHKWLNKQNNNKKLILFFNGWAMNEEVVSHLEKEDFDILMLFDYRDIKINSLLKTFEINFSKYNEKHLICWSMGVYISNLFKNELNNFNKKTAINGTAKIINNNFGIPEKIYNITTKFLNKENCAKFIQNMFSDNSYLGEIKIERPIEQLKEELITIKKIELNSTIDFTRAIISNDDKIVPTKNQIAFWKEQTSETSIDIINSTHCPFKIYHYWRELL